ncbi:Hypothetical protein CAP_8733 [Chondromyces apiculatus DSM 436]|uniref:PE-PGRS family protein n=2 Tax=Chondromyces apiculatus TaxID=51 RepID=A0A017SXS5_9BACT|nr:Hypothetical protein CAP_8733 [Chondromyces apiculatus DSM 436]
MPWLSRVAASVGLGAMASLSGCLFSTPLDCENAGVCSADEGEDILPEGCAGDPTIDPSLVTETCGVFVRATAAAGGDGTRERPYASISEAVEAAHGRRVYACAAGAFVEAVVIDKGVTVLGGFDCEAGWRWSVEARSFVEGPADAVAVTLGEGARGAKVQGFEIRAASATREGGSSVGVMVADVEATLAQVEVVAGDGKDGVAGVTPSEAARSGTDAPAEGVGGAASKACAEAGMVRGGLGGETMCDDGGTRGGDGGEGATGEHDNGRTGLTGLPYIDPNPQQYGSGGEGQLSSSDMCEDGEKGASGTKGADSGGGSATLLSLAGIGGGDGAPGAPGGRGHGGGGGGGTKAGAFCGSNVTGSGASGGGGGAGGCGGRGGGGGQAGGSSIGVVSLGARLVLQDVSVRVGAAGHGGGGAAGKNGGLGGEGAKGGADSGMVPSEAGCSGGDGGRGGHGGAGGGGRGGHAVGVAWAVTPGAASALQAFTAGAPGDGGTSSSGSAAENQGVDGKAGPCWDFAAGTACGG